jgi:hypothetical protein
MLRHHQQPLSGGRSGKRGFAGIPCGSIDASDGTRPRGLRRDRPFNARVGSGRSVPNRHCYAPGCRENTAPGRAVEPSRSGAWPARSGVEMVSA